MNKQFKKFCEKKKADLFGYYSKLKLSNIKLPITVLLGPNGTGKSLSLLNLDKELQLRGINFVKYSTSRDDIVQKGAPAFGNWDPRKLACAFHSEGEKMIDSFFDWANTTMLSAIMTSNKPLYILVDEADSGLSFDRLMESILQIIHIIVMEVDKGRDIHLVITCNSYEMLECTRSKYTDFIWVPTKEHIKVSSYYNFKKRYIEYYDAVLKEQ